MKAFDVVMTIVIVCAVASFSWGFYIVGCR